MSTNKTANYGLHLWEPGDDFLRSEFNANFSAIDAAARVACGVYAGDGAASRFIALGFTPRAVLVVKADGQTSNGYHMFGGLALPGRPVEYQGNEILAVVEGGIQAACRRISDSYFLASNNLNLVYHYLALR